MRLQARTQYDTKLPGQSDTRRASLKTQAFSQGTTDSPGPEKTINDTLSIETTASSLKPEKTAFNWTDLTSKAGSAGLVGFAMASLGASVHVCLPLPALAALCVLAPLVAGGTFQDPYNSYDSNLPGSFEAYKKREISHFLTGAAFGLGLSTAFSAGCLLGLPGALGAPGLPPWSEPFSTSPACCSKLATETAAEANWLNFADKLST